MLPGLDLGSYQFAIGAGGRGLFLLKFAIGAGGTGAAAAASNRLAPTVVRPSLNHRAVSCARFTICNFTFVGERRNFSHMFSYSSPNCSL